MDVVGLQEVRWPLAGKINTKDYVIYYSGNEDGQYRRGVGFAVSKRIQSAVIHFEATSERVCNIRIKGKFKNISVISFYAPTEDADDEEKDIFYESLEAEWRKLPNYDTKFLLGDANGKIGQEPVWKGTVGGNSLHKESNDNGIRLLSLAVSCDMKIVSTLFPRQDIYKATWVSPDGHTKNQIDHVLIDRRHSSHVTNVRTIRGAECGTDHYLILVKVKQRICIEKRKGQEKHEKIAVEKLREKETAKEFKIKLSNRFQILEEEEENDKLSIEEKWKLLRNTIQKCAEEVCGKKKRIKNKPWFDEDCRAMVNERKQAKDLWLKHGKEVDRKNYDVKARETVKILRRKKREWINRLLEKTEEDQRANNSREFYQRVRCFKKDFKPNAYGIKNKAGQVIIQKTESLEVWREYFCDLLNGEEDTNHTERAIFQNVQPFVPNPSIEEVKGAINDLKNNKAPGEDGVTAEMLKAGGQLIIDKVHRLINEIWNKEAIPAEWQEALVVPIHKKGDKQECNNYRGISLLNVTYKILSKIIQRRLEEYTDSFIGEQQAGFTRGRSTIDQIFILKECLAKYWEFNRECYCLFIDFKKAYDSLFRAKIWEKMEKFGVPNKLIRLVSMCVSNSRCKVKIDGETTTEFSVNTGVRQGDGLSPLLFNIALEEALQIVKNSHLGLKLETNINILAFADDVVLMAEKEEDLKILTEMLIKETEYVGLRINDTKTKFMRVTREEAGNNDVSFLVNNHKFQKVNDFTYLGVRLSNKNTEEMEIQNRINLANKSWYACSKLMKSKLLTRNTKIRIYKTIVRPVLLYGGENWILNKNMEKKLVTFENKVLRTIYGPVCEDGVWRIRHNQEIRGLFQDHDIVGEVKSRRLRWVGHILRRNEESLLKMALRGNPRGRRPVGRPKARWWDQVRKDLETMRLREEDAEDRDYWRRRVGEAKFHLGYKWPWQ